MKILYVDYYYEYGNRSRGINYIGIDGFEQGLKQLGNDVYHFYYDEYISDLPELNRVLIEYVEKLSPELVFFNLYNNIIEVETIKKISTIANTVNWFGDDPFLFDSFTSLYAPYFSYCITTDKFSIKKYYALGQEKIIYSQWPAFAPLNDKFLEANNYKYDVSFVGAKNPPREWFVNELRKKGIDINVFGNGWASGPIDDNTMREVFAKSKINLNISNSDIWDYQFLFSGYCHFKILVRKLIEYHLIKNKATNAILRMLKKDVNRNITFYGKFSSQIKARNFEIPCGYGFQLTNYVPTLEDYFVLGKEIACYSNVDEAEKQIRYYLEEDVERENIKIAGFNRAIKDFTYEEALSKIMEQINHLSKGEL